MKEPSPGISGWSYYRNLRAGRELCAAWNIVPTQSFIRTKWIKFQHMKVPSNIFLELIISYLLCFHARQVYCDRLMNPPVPEIQGFVRLFRFYLLATLIIRTDPCWPCTTSEEPILIVPIEMKKTSLGTLQPQAVDECFGKPIKLEHHCPERSTWLPVCLIPSRLFHRLPHCLY